MFKDVSADAITWLPGKEQAEINELLKNNIVGGPAIVFKR
jgi:hypothetical protein